MSFLGPKQDSGAGFPPNHYSQRPQSVPNYPAYPQCLRSEKKVHFGFEP